jgi:manganese transport protein
VVTEIQDAHPLLAKLLSPRLAPIVFALALICSGQSSTITGTLAGQITMEGFLRFRVRPWLRRLVTRLMAIVPAVAVIWVMGDQGAMQLLLLSQVILSLQLAFAVIPLVKFTGSKQKMGPFVNRPWVKGLAWLVTAVILGLNGKLVYDQTADWMDKAGSSGWLVLAGMAPLVALLAVLLLWMMLRREHAPAAAPGVSAEDVVTAAAGLQKRFKRIGVALDVQPGDSVMLAEAVALAKTHKAELVLMHVVDTAGGQWYGPQTGDLERRHDEAYLDALAERLGRELADQGVPKVEAVLGYGSPPKEIVNLTRQLGIDLVVLGGHGHRRSLDWFYGETVSNVRHGLTIPVYTVRG